MKRWFIAIILFVFGIASAQSDSFGLVLQANDAYMTGDYETAQALYEVIIQNGVRDFRVYFNLGNTYYQSGHLGRALLNYRRAQEILPRDADLGNNLARVRTERFDLLSDETGFGESLAALTTGILNLSELSVIVFFIWLFWFAMLGIATIKISWRTRMRPPLLLTGIVLLLGLFLLGGRLETSIRRPPAVVIDEVVQVRSGPGEAYLELYQLHAAAEVYVWETKKEWIQFALADGRLGWIPLKTITLIQQ
jgi:tetratricopeptide (TPR) repeat protein